MEVTQDDAHTYELAKTVRSSSLVLAQGFFLVKGELFLPTAAITLASAAAHPAAIFGLN